MLFVHTLAVVLHVATAAAYFGLGLLLARQARIVAGGHAAALGELGGRTVRLMTAFAVLTFVFALAAFLLGGGFVGYGPAYHTSLLLIVLLIGVQVLLVQRGWDALRAAVSGPADASAAAKRVAMGTGIAHTLWLVILVLMFWDRFAVALL